MSKPTIIPIGDSINGKGGSLTTFGRAATPGEVQVITCTPNTESPLPNITAALNMLGLILDQRVDLRFDPHLWSLQLEAARKELAQLEVKP